MVFPFEKTAAGLRQDLDECVDAVFASLESEFLVMPKDEGFVEYSVFERAYEELKRGTREFEDCTCQAVLPIVLRAPVAIIVLRAMLGFSPPEWAYVTKQRSAADVSQGFARGLDRQVRLRPLVPLRVKELKLQQITAMITVACDLLRDGPPDIAPSQLHRLDKADTKLGLGGLRSMARMGVPYAMLLYERFLGRPFAGHRDSVSELVGDRLELLVEEALVSSGISYRKTKRAERVTGFDQAPDFMVPSEFNPEVVIEAKLTEDDGTARDKITRVQHLGELANAREASGALRFEVVACIAGRGFGVRREDMKKLLLATNGKVFTPSNLDRLIECTSLARFRAR